MATETQYNLPPVETTLTESDIQRIIDATLADLGSTILKTGAGNQALKAGPDGLWLGNAEFGSAPFRVNLDGDLTATSATLTGSITATSGAIGGFDIGSDYLRDAANSFGLASTVTGGDDVRFWAGDTFANRATADFNVTEAGVVTASNITITGGDISGTPISSIPNNASTDISLLDATHDLVFSSTDADTVSWASGTITLSNGRTFAIDAGNTGNMAARTWIYLDPDTSSTVLQTTTTVATAMGANKKIIAIAENETDGAVFQVLGGQGGVVITPASVITNSLSAIVADMGSITAGTITGATIQTASSGDRFNMTSSAFQGIEAGGNVVFEVVVSGGDAGDVIMGDDATNTYAKWDDSAGKFIVSTGQGTFGGNGSDGALSISSGTTTIDLANAAVVIKNYTSISITGTGKLAFSNPNSAGTLIILKSQGDVTITSSTTPCIDAAGLGAAGGAGGTGASSSANDGADGTEGTLILDDNIHEGGKGTGGTDSGSAGSGGTAGVIYANKFLYTTLNAKAQLRAIDIAPGSGGGGGGGGDYSATGNGAGGTGGKGGGALVIECAGALDFTAANGISVAGADGSAGSDVTIGAADEDDGGGGGGGGGAGGMCVLLYNTLTASSGTINNAGGAGGDGALGGTSYTGSGRGGGGGAGAGAYGAAGGNGGDGGVDDGSNGSAAGGSNAGGGGGGGARASNRTAGTGGSAGGSSGGLVVQNLVYT